MIKFDKVSGQLREADHASKTEKGVFFSIKNSQWNSQQVDSGQWEDVNGAGSLTFENNKVVITPAGTTNYNKYFRYALIKTASKNFSITAKYTLPSVFNSSSGGLLFGFCSGADTNYVRSLQWRLSTKNDATQGKVIIYYGESGTSATTGNAILPVAIGDVVRMEAVYMHHSLFVKYTNLTQGASTQHYIRLSGGNPQYAPNLGNFSITSHGGVHDLTELEAFDHTLKGMDLLLLGDSITSFGGTTTSKLGRDWASMIQSRFSKSAINRYCGSGDMVNHYIQDAVLADIIALAPQNVFILLGTNDLAFSRTLEQLKTDYQTLVIALKNAGITIIHGGLTPSNSYDVRGFNTWLVTQYPNDIIVDLFSPLCDADVNTATGATYGLSVTYGSDNVHPNDAGNLRIADVIAAYLIKAGVLPAQESPVIALS